LDSFLPRQEPGLNKGAASSRRRRRRSKKEALERRIAVAG